MVPDVSLDDRQLARALYHAGDDLHPGGGERVVEYRAKRRRLSVPFHDQLNTGQGHVGVHDTGHGGE